MAEKPSIPKGTRDFTPLEMTRRNYIFDTIRRIFRTYGYLPIETLGPGDPYEKVPVLLENVRQAIKTAGA